MGKCVAAQELLNTWSAGGANRPLHSPRRHQVAQLKVLHPCQRETPNISHDAGHENAEANDQGRMVSWRAQMSSLQQVFRLSSRRSWDFQCFDRTEHVFILRDTNNVCARQLLL